MIRNRLLAGLVCSRGLRYLNPDFIIPFVYVANDMVAARERDSGMVEARTGERGKLEELRQIVENEIK